MKIKKKNNFSKNRLKARLRKTKINFKKKLFEVNNITSIATGKKKNSRKFKRFF